jgi:hypothetical protein
MKLVKEILYEKFTEDSDPIHDMGIGSLQYLDKIAVSILKADTKKMFYTLRIEDDIVKIWFNSPNLNKTKYIKTHLEAENYVKKILYKKLKLENIFIFEGITGEGYIQNNEEVEFNAHFKLFKKSNKIIEIQRPNTWVSTNDVEVKVNETIDK